jgi:uncharacterized membrane protein YdbT with pleckstrin-like domain
MSYIEESLSAGESIVARFNLHWTAYVPVVFYVLIIVGIPVAIYQWLVLRNIEQGVTNKRVIYKKGIVSRSTDEMKLTSIETVEIEQSVLGRMLGYGDVKVTGRGLSDLVFRGIDDPMRVKRYIESVSHPAN